VTGFRLCIVIPAKLHGDRPKGTGFIATAPLLIWRIRHRLNLDGPLSSSLSASQGDKKLYTQEYFEGILH
jgi:hypothetical protein